MSRPLLLHICLQPLHISFLQLHSSLAFISLPLVAQSQSVKERNETPETFSHCLTLHFEPAFWSAGLGGSRLVS